MPVFQFKCENCSSIFEHFISSKADVSCVACGGSKVFRVENTFFYPNKIFCPHDKELNPQKLQSELGEIFQNTDEKCGRCGTDGAPGRCKSKSGGCGKNCSCKNKLNPCSI